MLHLHWFYVNITVTKMLLTSLNFDQNQRIFFWNEAQNSGCLLKKTEILSEAQKKTEKTEKTEIKTEKQITDMRELFSGSRQFFSDSQLFFRLARIETKMFKKTFSIFQGFFQTHDNFFQTHNKFSDSRQICRLTTNRTHIMLHLHWFYVNITVTKTLLTSLNFDQNQIIFF